MSAALAEFEQALNQFYGPSITDQARRDIEAGLKNFKSRPDAWMQCCGFLKESNNEYVLFFSASLLVDFVRYSWTTVPQDKRIELRTFLFEVIHNKFASTPPYVTSKISQVLVDIGKRDWPHSDQEFVNQVLQLCEASETSQRIGLQLLKMISEDFTQTKESSGLTTVRKVELENMLAQYLPRIMGMLTQTLQHVFSAVQAQQQQDACAIAQLCLSITLDIMRWAPLRQPEASGLTDAFVEIMFKYVTLINQDEGQLAVSFFNELLEKRYMPEGFKSFFAKLTENFMNIFLAIANHSNIESMDQSFLSRFTLLLSTYSKLHLNRMQCDANIDLATFLETMRKYTLVQPYQEEFEECLDIWTVLVSTISERDNVPVDVVKVCATFAGDLVSRCQWHHNATFLCTISNERTGTSSDKRSADADEVGNVDKLLESSISDLSTELTEVIDHVATVVMQIAHLSYAQGYDLGELLHMVHSELGTRVQTLVAASSSGISGTELERIATDCSSLLQLLGFLSNSFSSPSRFAAGFEGGFQIVSGAIQLVDLCTSNRLHSLGQSFVMLHIRALGTLSSFSHWLVHFGLVVGGIQSPKCCGQVETLQVIANQGKLANQPSCNLGKFHEITESAVKAITSSTWNEVSPLPQSIMAAAAHCLSGLLGNSLAKHLSNLAPIQRLFTDLSVVVRDLPLSIQIMFFLAICGSIQNELEVETKGVSSVEAVVGHPLSQRFSAILLPHSQVVMSAESSTTFTNVDQLIQSRDSLRRSLSILTAVIPWSAGKSTVIQAVVHNAIAPAIPGGLRLLVAAIEPGPPKSTQLNSLARDSATFCLSFYGTLTRLAGQSSFQQCIQVLVNVLENKSLNQIIGNGIGGSFLLLKLMRLLEIVVSQPGKVFDQLLNQVINLIFNQLLGIVKQVNNANTVDVLESFHKIVTQLFATHWTWFTVPVQQSNNNGTLAGATVGFQKSKRTFRSEDAKNVFVTAMTFILESLRAEVVSPELSNQILSGLCDLNRTIRLFAFDGFASDMLPVFVCTLLDLMILRPLEILESKVIETIRLMAETNFDSFFQHILPQYVESKAGSSLQLATQSSFALFSPDRDIPTFEKNLKSFLNDCRALKDPDSE